MKMLTKMCSHLVSRMVESRTFKEETDSGKGEVKEHIMGDYI